MANLLLAVEHPDGLVASQSLRFGKVPESSSIVELSQDVFAPASFGESVGDHTLVTHLTDIRGVQRPVALFYQSSSGHHISLVPPTAFLAEKERLQEEMQQSLQHQQFLWSQNEAFSQQLTAAKELLADNVVSHRSLLDQVSRMSRAAAEAASEAERLKEEVARLSSNRAEVDADRSRLEMELAEASTKAASALQQTRSQGKDLVAVLQLTVGLRQELAHQALQLAEAMELNNAIQFEVQAAATKQAITNRALEHATLTYQELCQDHEQQRQEADNATATLSRLTEELQKHSKQLRGVEADRSAAARRAEQAVQAKADLEVSVDRLQSQLATSLKEVKSLKSDAQGHAMELLRATIADKHEAAQNLRLQLDKAKQHTEWLHDNHKVTIQVCLFLSRDPTSVHPLFSGLLFNCIMQNMSISTGKVGNSSKQGVSHHACSAKTQPGVTCRLDSSCTLLPAVNRTVLWSCTQECQEEAVLTDACVVQQPFFSKQPSPIKDSLGMPFAQGPPSNTSYGVHHELTAWVLAVALRWLFLETSEVTIGAVCQALGMHASSAWPRTDFTC